MKVLIERYTMETNNCKYAGVKASQAALVVKSPPASAADTRRGFDPRVRMIPWRRAEQPTPAFLPGESHGQKSLVGYSPQGCTESDVTEVTYHARRLK